MTNRFEKFTERARLVLTRAQEEALSFSHNYIGTEHLLLGLLSQPESVAGQVLQTLAVEPDQVRSSIEVAIGKGTAPVSGQAGLTPRAKKVIELAVAEARQLNHSYIGTEHILLGLLVEGEGVAHAILTDMGVDIANARTEVSRVLGGGLPERTRRMGMGAPPAGSQPQRLVYNAALLSNATRLLEEALAALHAMRRPDLGSQLIEALIVPELQAMLSALSLSAENRAELEEASARLMNALGLTTTAAAVIKSHDAAAGEALETANAAVWRAVLPFTGRRGFGMRGRWP